MAVGPDRRPAIFNNDCIDHRPFVHKDRKNFVQTSYNVLQNEFCCLLCYAVVFRRPHVASVRLSVRRPRASDIS